MPAPAAGEVTLRVAACGICGSDVHEYVRGPCVVPTPERANRLTGAALPLVLGHEFAGEIVALGHDAPARLTIGERVAVQPVIACGRCTDCRAGARHRCQAQAVIGLSAPGGGFASHATIPGSSVHPLPRALDPVLGALVEPLAVGWHGVRRSGLRAGNSALVIGAGPIGLAALMALTAGRAGPVTVTARRDGARARMAARLGAATVIAGKRAGDLHEVREPVGADGYDAVFLAAASPKALDLALRAVRPGGTIVQLALWDQPAELDLNRLLAREVQLIGSMAYGPGEFAEVIDAIADGTLTGAIGMVTARVSLEQAVAGGFDRLAAADPDQIKVIVEP